MDATGYNPIAVANALVKVARADARKHEVNHLKVQKCVYIAHGVYLAKCNAPLVSEGFEAWQYGPVSPDLYHAAKRRGRWELNELLVDEQGVVPVLGDSEVVEIVEGLMSEVWRVYGPLTAFQLVSKTHEPGTPWWEVTDGGVNLGRNKPIPDSVICEYWQDRLRPN